MTLTHSLYSKSRLLTHNIRRVIYLVFFDDSTMGPAKNKSTFKI